MSGIWNIRKYFLLSIVKSIFLSVEFAVLIVFSVLYFLRVLRFDQFALFLFYDYEIVRWVALGLPIALFLGSLKLQKRLFQPEENNKILYNWPDYTKYEATTYVGIFFCFLPIIPTFISWIYFEYYCKYDVGFYWTLLIVISFVSITSLYFARYKIIYILQKMSLSEDQND